MASTPSPLPDVASDQVLEQLEFAAALEAVARWAVSPLGAASLRSRRPANSLQQIVRELGVAAEFQQLLDSGDPFRPEAVPDISPVIGALRVAGHVLEAEDLNAAKTAIEGMNSVSRGLERIAEVAPAVGALAEAVPPLGIAEAIDRALDPDGSVKDDASPELARARRKVRETRARLVQLLERQLRQYARDGTAGEVTVRGGRYVIPVRRDDRGRVRGIVHGESSSGATLFVEPPEAVELGNELNGWEAEEKRAVLAVLRGLTDLVRPHVESLVSGLTMCRRVDDAYARARYAIETDGHMPALTGVPGRMTICRGMHPLLLAEGNAAVPFDLMLTSDERTLLVSGPNAGGKTVLLKAVGLLAALTQAGVIPPVGPGTTIPVFDHMFVDIGDHQSIAASLSTFSAHVAALRDVLRDSDGASLVLLDEVGGGTDPMEGAALAGATLLSLNTRGATTVATTHLSELKDLAAKTDGMVNGSLQFDTETLAPTYRFVKDQPGRSYGIAIARRLGLPPDVLETAEALQPRQARTLDAVLADVEQQERELSQRREEIELEAARLEKLRNDTEALGRSLEERRRELDERDSELEREGRTKAREYLLQARRRVEEALGVARGAVDQAAVKEARRLVEEGVREEGEILKRLETAGWKVRGTGNGERGTGSVQREAGSGGAVAGEREPGTGNGEWGTERPGVGAGAPAYETGAASDIDLRGLTGDEAEAALVLAIDAAVADDLPWLRIIHGKGTGVLRNRVGQVLKRDRRVASFRLAPPEQGGSGVTMVEFKQ